MTEKLYDIPIGIFTFNRLDTTKEVFSVVRQVKPRRLYLISDGWRKSKAGEKEKVEAVRSYLESNVDWECEVKKNYAPENMGCRKRMASGITWLFENEEMAIILEDDIKPTLDFFPYAEEMLHRYKDDKNVMLVSGFKYVSDYNITDSYFFSNHPMIWGWGSWRRAWDHYDIDIPDWPESKRQGSLRKYFNWGGYQVAKHDFDSVYNHKRDTWDFQWTYSVLSNDGLAVIPSVNLIENLGCGRDDATHTTGESDLDFQTYPLKKPYKHPECVKANQKYDEEFLRRNWGAKELFKKLNRRIIGIFKK